MNSNKFHSEFKKLESIIKEHKNFLLVIHPGPDADALGSSFSLKNYIESFADKIATIYSVDMPSDSLKPLFNLKTVTTDLKLHDKDVIIILDRGDVYYKLGIDEKINNLKNPPQEIINIDHHPRTTINTALNIRTTTAAATSEIIYSFFKQVSFQYSQKISQYLLNGIYADTGGFKHNNTSPEILEIAGNLMRKGASISKINRALIANKSVSVLKLWGLALERVHVNKKTGMAVSFLTEKDLQKHNTSMEELYAAKLSELINTIADTKFSLILTERNKNKIKASLRSEPYKKIDVSKIAQSFKGGGHKLASGFEIEGRLHQTKDGWEIK
jgi:phosphoesterase RecJ-like protein